MTAEITVRAEQIEPIGEPVVACMGTIACRRVCGSVLTDHSLAPADPSFALPFEKNCSILNTITSLDGPTASEILSAITLPKQVGSLRGEEVTDEATSYLGYLEKEGAAFDGFLQSFLRGTNQPRSALNAAKQAYETSKVYEGKHTPSTDQDKEELLGFYGVLRGIYDRHTLAQTGLLFDGAMEQMFIQAAKEIGVGHHIKLVGEPGIAKTTFAKYLAFQNAKAYHPDISENDLLPTVISFSSTSEAESHMSEQTFQEGTLGSQLGRIGKAMKQGRGVVLDEQNGMTPDQQTFFNDLFLKKPGQSVTINGETFEVAKGFCVIATLNPMTDSQGNRRHGRQQQDSANAARFTRIDFKYPHQKGYAGNSTETISRIFLAHYVDNYGWKTPDTSVINLLDSINELMRNITTMATEPAKDGTATSITASQARPDLAECISPRDLGRILELGFAYGDSESAVDNIRKLIYYKIQQILDSDNGHFVTQKTKDSVNIHLKNAGFHA